MRKDGGRRRPVKIGTGASFKIEAVCGKDLSGVFELAASCCLQTVRMSFLVLQRGEGNPWLFRIGL